MKVYGKNAVVEAIKSGRPIEKVYLQFGRFFEPELINLLKERGIPFQWAKKEQIKKLSGTSKSQGVVAIVSPVKYSPLKELFEETFSKNSFFVALDAITEPQNLGTIARTVESFGGIGLLLPKKGGAPLNEVAVKASSGALFHLRVCRVNSLREALEEFKASGGAVYSVETGGEDIREVNLKEPACLVLGSEGRGISKELLSLSNRVLTIPTVGKTPSLNVSASCAIAVWELFKR
ncbi:23S rRNA (guanosine(2251)-2'-O)-methyltransferase RlmB [Thermovibrio sp.]